MKKDILFKILDQKSREELLNLLDETWQVVSTNQRKQIFSLVMQKEQYNFPANTEQVLATIKQFHKDSYDGKFYAPFEVNSKNYMDTPLETDDWFARLDELFIDCTKLANQKEHDAAIEGFELLFELTDAIDSGEEIVFADELGMWMFTGDEKTYFTAYIHSVAGSCKGEDFVEKMVHAVHQDSDRACRYNLYPVVQSLASQEQMALIDESIKSRGIKVVVTEGGDL